MKALVTGGTGFVGGHLLELLRDDGLRLVATGRDSRWPSELEHLASSVQLRSLDVNQPDQWRELLERERPDQIYHLAGQSQPALSYRDPETTWRINTLGTRLLLNAMTRHCPESRVIVFSSGSVYGQPRDEEMPITEGTPFRPESPYAVSKAAADLLTLAYGRRGELIALVVRPFNHIGPRQRSDFAIAHFAARIAQIEASGAPGSLPVGHQDVARDFLDVRDAVRAYRALMQKGEAGQAYVVASGHTVLLRNVVERLRNMAGQPIRVEDDPDKLKRRDPLRLEASPEKLRARTGWQSCIPLEQTLQDTLDDWRRNGNRRGQPDAI